MTEFNPNPGVLTLPQAVKARLLQNADTEVLTDQEKLTSEKFRVFNSRSDFEAATIPDSVTHWTVLHAGRALDYARDPDGTAIESANEVKGSPANLVRPEHWGAAGDGTTDDTAAIQAGIDWLEAKGGGPLHFRARRYVVSGTIRVRKNAWLVGEGWRFQGDYTDNVLIEGSWIELAPGSNTDVVLFRADPGPGETVRQRIHAGIRDIGVFGRRSDLYLQTNKDLNSVGSGVRIDGVSYVTLDNVCFFKCADHGVISGSFNYGGGVGLFSPNNLVFRNCSSLVNGGDGFRLFGGDSFMIACNAGNNGLRGFFGGLSNTSYNGCSGWDNIGHNLQITERGVSVDGGNYYDSRTASGISLIGANVTNCHIVGAQVFDNNHNPTSDPMTQAGIAIQSNVPGPVSIVGCGLFNSPHKLPDQFQRRGIFVADAPVHLTIQGNRYAGHTVADETILNRTNLNRQMTGGQFTGAIEMDGRDILTARRLTLSPWQNRNTNAAQELNVSSNGLISINGGQESNPVARFDANTTDVGHPFVIIRVNRSEPATFVHNPDFLRLIGGQDRVLAQHEAIMFVHVEGDIWQEVGIPGAAGGGEVTAEEVRDLLADLQGDDRLAAPAIRGLARPPGLHSPLRPAAGQIISNLAAAVTAGTGAQTADRTTVGPFMPQHDLTLDRVGMVVHAGEPGALLKVVIFEADHLGRPTGESILESDVLDASETATRLTDVTPVTLLAGRTYWIGGRSSGTPTVRIVPTSAAVPISSTTAVSPVQQMSLIRSEPFADPAAPWVYAGSQHSVASVPLVLMSVE